MNAICTALDTVGSTVADLLPTVADLLPTVADLLPTRTFQYWAASEHANLNLRLARLLAAQYSKVWVG